MTVSDPSQKHQRREHGLMLALVSPALLVILLLIVLPVGWLAWQSIYHDGFTLENYRRVFTEDIYWRSFALTFEISLAVTLIALLLGYPLAYLANSVPKAWSILILSLVVLPFWTSVLVRAYAWLALLQRSGVINQFLRYFDVISEPLALVHNSFGTVVATVHILLPFMVLPLYATMQKIPGDLMQAGASLGASPSLTFFRVFLPLSLPGVLAALHHGVRALPRLLYHAGAARRRPHRDGIDARESQRRALQPVRCGQRRRRRAAHECARDLLRRQPLHLARPRAGAEMMRISPARIALYAISALVLVYLILPVLIIAPISFSSARFLTFPPPSFSTRWYQQYFTNPAWMQATRVTLTVALFTVVIATPCGVAAAYAISQSKLRIMRVVHMALLLPLVVPIIITAVGIFFVYAKVGLVATMPGLVLANVMLGLPYVVISVLAGLQSFDPAQEMVARSLGMNRLRSFFAVTLPQIKSSVVAGGIFAFISAMDETIVALFISGGQYQPLTKRMFTALRDEIDPTIGAISTLMTAASFLLVLLATTRQKRKVG
ncbi:ABC-type spermidine/putrescine transport system permease subunit II [Bradyrhizobium ottawaense]